MQILCWDAPLAYCCALDWDNMQLGQEQLLPLHPAGRSAPLRTGQRTSLLYTMIPSSAPQAFER